RWYRAHLQLISRRCPGEAANPLQEARRGDRVFAPQTSNDFRARLTAGYSSSLVRMREFGAGSRTATPPTCQPWLLWIASARTVSTGSSRVGLISTSPP